jgi:hypothetical protein
MKPPNPFWPTRDIFHGKPLRDLGIDWHRCDSCHPDKLRIVTKFDIFNDRWILCEGCWLDYWDNSDSIPKGYRAVKLTLRNGKLYIDVEVHYGIPIWNCANVITCPCRHGDVSASFYR